METIEEKNMELNQNSSLSYLSIRKIREEMIEMYEKILE